MREHGGEIRFICLEAQTWPWSNLVSKFLLRI